MFELSDFKLSQNDKKFLLSLARESIKDHLAGLEIRNYDEDMLSPGVLQRAGAFVSLHKSDQLRGCIGRFSSDECLFRLIQKVAVSSAFRDYRFEPVTSKEMNEIEIELSVLSPLRKIESVEEFSPGIHGIYMKKGDKTGTFLPQVVRKTKWSKEELLGYCARDKAEIGWDGWKDAELYIYNALIFSEQEINFS